MTITALLLSFVASAQVRTYGDMETKTFVIGLSMYYFGDTGTLTLFSGTTVNVSGNRVTSGGKVLLENAPAGNTLIGAHDFTDDGTPELVVATRGEGMEDLRHLIYLDLPRRPFRLQVLRRRSRPGARTLRKNCRRIFADGEKSLPLQKSASYVFY